MKKENIFGNRAFINVRGDAGADLSVIYEKFMTLKEANIVGGRDTITWNGCILHPTLYDNKDDFFATYTAFLNGDKKAIVEHLPKDADAADICLWHLNQSLQERGSETFSSAEIDQIIESIGNEDKNGKSI